MSISSEIKSLLTELPATVTLVAVSKTHPAEMVAEAYGAGQRDFGENRPQEMTAKQAQLPHDIRWHQIGHLQTNKVRMIAPYVAMIHSVDSAHLLQTVNAEAVRVGRCIDVLMEVHIAAEESKEGWCADELVAYINTEEWRKMQGVRLRGVMGVATNTDDTAKVRREFTSLRMLFDRLKPLVGDSFDTISMGMTSDYRIAVECGATMVRIGSRIFGARYYPPKA